MAEQKTGKGRGSRYKNSPSTSKAKDAIKSTNNRNPDGRNVQNNLPNSVFSNPLVLTGIGLVAAGLTGFILKKLFFKDDAAKGRYSNVKPSLTCVPTAKGDACIVKRVIAGDNSCLFNAVGYCLDKSLTRAPRLRAAVAAEVAKHPDIYTTAFLGMPNEDYCRWIQTPHNWGGGIELSILSKMYGVELAAWNVETCICHVFGEDKKYSRRAQLIYNGTHYDALVVADGTSSSMTTDETIINPRTARGRGAIRAAKRLVRLTHAASKFDSTGKQRLRCTAEGCGKRFFSEAAAKVHAKEMGHDHFEEF